MEMSSKEYNGLCSCGKEHSVVVDVICIESGASEKLKEELINGKYAGYKHPVIICDDNTWPAAEESLKGIPVRCERLMLPSQGLHADNHGVGLVKEKWKSEYDIILAVGAGSVHDISRYVAHDIGIPFISYPTAASVDGFVSTVAAMTWDGMKTTLPAVAPVAVYADTRVFSKAPYRLTASGISDLLGKYTALADWKISHLLTGEHFCERIDKMERKAIAEVLACIDDLKDGMDSAYEKLMYALLLSGLAMQMMGNSRPASGAEHHVSHLWEMEVINPTLDALHGEKVSIGLLLVLEKYEGIAEGMSNGRYKVKEYKGMPHIIEQRFKNRGILDGVIKENTPEPLEKISTAKLMDSFTEITKILKELPSFQEMEATLVKAGCACKMSDIGLANVTDEGDRIKDITLSMSPYVRNRLTMMRVNWMLEEI